MQWSYIILSVCHRVYAVNIQIFTYHDVMDMIHQPKDNLGIKLRLFKLSFLCIGDTVAMQAEGLNISFPDNDTVIKARTDCNNQC